MHIWQCQWKYEVGWTDTCLINPSCGQSVYLYSKWSSWRSSTSVIPLPSQYFSTEMNKTAAVSTHTHTYTHSDSGMVRRQWCKNSSSLPVNQTLLQSCRLRSVMKSHSSSLSSSLYEVPSLKARTDMSLLMIATSHKVAVIWYIPFLNILSYWSDLWIRGHIFLWEPWDGSNSTTHHCSSTHPQQHHCRQDRESTQWKNTTLVFPLSFYYPLSVLAAGWLPAATQPVTFCLHERLAQLRETIPSTTMDLDSGKTVLQRRVKDSDLWILLSTLLGKPGVLNKFLRMKGDGIQNLYTVWETCKILIKYKSQGQVACRETCKK